MAFSLCFSSHRNLFLFWQKPFVCQCKGFCKHCASLKLFRSKASESTGEGSNSHQAGNVGPPVKQHSRNVCQFSHKGQYPFHLQHFHYSGKFSFAVKAGIPPKKSEVWFLKGERILCSIHHKGYSAERKVPSIKELASMCR